MNYIVWNVRGGNNAEFKRHCLAMVQMYKSAMLVLLETRMADHKKLTKEMQFHMLIQSLLVGLSGGIVTMCKADCVQVAAVSTTP